MEKFHPHIIIRVKSTQSNTQEVGTIARSLANDPRIILADEPTGNLDSRTAESIISLLKRINSERGTTILIVTHDAHVAAHAHRTIHFLDGRVVRD